MKHTGQLLQKIEEALERDFFMTAETAKDFGLVDKVIDHRPGDTTACSRVLNGHASSLSPWLEVFTINSCEV